MEPLVSTAWLAAEIGKPDLLIFDATKFLPGADRDGRAEYATAHIPGARYFDIDAIADNETELPHMVPAAGRFARLAGALGIGNASRIVFYDNNEMMWAARGWWLLGLFGHACVGVLDGGLVQWRAEGRATEAGVPDAPAPASFRPDFHASRLRGIGDMLDNVRTQAELVIDARGAARFAAQAPEPRPGMRGGHIPGSVNVPYGDLLAADKTLRPAAELRARFALAGVDGGRKVVTSCGSGVSASLLALGLRVAGFDQGALYDGSWTEWGGRPDTPVET